MREDPSTNSPIENRRLTAIVFTDVAGFSARVQQDEIGTLVLVRTDFARMSAIAAQHNGEVLNSMGDGLLLCFESVVQAVACALQIQKEFSARQPDALQHRIGIHLGDVFRSGGDVTGDGVNLASRLQTKALPGTVCLSQSVYDAVKGKLPMQVEPLGKKQFKNIAEPISVFLVWPGGDSRIRLARPRRRVWKASLTVLAFGLGYLLWLKTPRATPPAALVPAAEVHLSEARRIARHALTVWNMQEATVDTSKAAEELVARATLLDPSDNEVWAAAAMIDSWSVCRGFDPSKERQQKAQEEAARAVALAPDSVTARHSQAFAFAFAVGSPAARGEAETMYRSLVREHPDDKSMSWEFAVVLRDEGKFEEAAVLDEKIGGNLEAGWNYYVAQRFDKATSILDHLQGAERLESRALLLRYSIDLYGHEDLAAGAATVAQFTPDQLLADDAEMAAAYTELCSRKPDEVIRLLNEFPREILSNPEYFGPKRYFSGLAYEMAGRADAARAEWKTALKQTNELLETKSNDVRLLWDQAVLLACLGKADEAGQVLQLQQSYLEPNSHYIFWASTVLLRMGRREEALATVSSVIHAKPPFWEGLHSVLRFFPEFDPLRDDSRFGKLLRDNMPKSAKPFDSLAAKDGSMPGPSR
jgi:class 3 adenylate cyclase/tetratricopeptide (TPR) repeat protein